jgi:hypothetical protein
VANPKAPKVSQGAAMIQEPEDGAGGGMKKKFEKVFD